MAKAVYIRSEGFEAALYLDKLLEFPRRSYRKLLRIAKAAPWENEAAMGSLKNYLTEQVETTKTAWVQASVEYRAGWKLVPNKRSRDVESLEILCNNRRLKDAVKRTKKAHEAAVGLKTIFDEECY